MSEEQHKTGYELLNKLNDGKSEKMIKKLSGVAPDVSDYIINFAFGEIYSRTHLDVKLRQIVTITALLTQGDADHQLETHIKGALNFGWQKNEIVEMFIQAIPYVGFPKVLNAINLAKKVVKNK